jgi:predicted CopG family antitoxin
MESIENIVETASEVVKDVYETLEKTKKSKDDTIEDCFEVLAKEKDKEIRVLNVLGGCIMNTYIKGSVSSVFIPGNHIKDGKLTTM